MVPVLEKTLESPLDSKEIKPNNPKGNQPWIFIGRADAKAEAPILWPPDVKSQLIWKDLDVSKEWGQEEKRVIEYEMVGWHHWLCGHKFEQTLGDGEGQASLACCSPCVAKSLTWLSNWTTQQFQRLMNGKIIPTILGKGWRFLGTGPPYTPWSFNSVLELSWSLWLRQLECWWRIKV